MSRCHRTQCHLRMQRRRVTARKAPDRLIDDSGAGSGEAGCAGRRHRHSPSRTGRSLTEGQGGADAAGVGAHARAELGEVDNVLKHAVERRGQSQSGQNAAAGKGGHAPAEPGFVFSHLLCA